MGGLQHLGHQGRELIKVDLPISISIQLLEYLVNGGLIFGVLGEGAAETASSDSPRPPSPGPSSLEAQRREAQEY